MNQTVESALGFLSKLIDIDVLHQGLIEVVLGIVLHLDNAHSTHAYNFYRYELNNPAASTNLIKNVDFRVPVNPGKAGHEFLYILLESPNWSLLNKYNKLIINNYTNNFGIIVHEN